MIKDPVDFFLLFFVAAHTNRQSRSLMAQQWGRSISFGCVPCCRCVVTNGPTLQICVSKIFQRDAFISDRIPSVCLHNNAGGGILLARACRNACYARTNIRWRRFDVVAALEKYREKKKIDEYLNDRKVQLFSTPINISFAIVVSQRFGSVHTEVRKTRSIS